MFSLRFSIGRQNASTMLALAWSLLAVPCVAQERRWTPPSSPPVVPAGAPAMSLWQIEGATVRFGARDAPLAIYRDVSCDLLGKRVSFDWRYAAKVSGFNSVKSSTDQSFDTEYWPTRTIVLDLQHLCVAGKSPDGATILERWTFASKSSKDAAVPSVELSCGADGSQPARYEWTIPPRANVETILRASADAPQGMIRGLLRDLRWRDKLLVYYDTSREVYSLDLPTHDQTLVAGPSESSRLRVTALSDNYRNFWSADYVKRGYCYFFGPEMGVISKEGNPMILVLIDSDRDGKIDSSTIVDGKQWGTDGWSDLMNIVSHGD